MDLTGCKLAGGNEAAYKKYGNLLLEKCRDTRKKMEKEEETAATLLRFLPKVWTFLDDYWKNSGKLFQAALEDPMVLLGEDIQTKSQAADLLWVPTKGKDVVVQYFRKFVLMRRTLPKSLVPASPEAEFPFTVTSVKGTTMSMSQIMRREGMGYPCFEYTGQILAARYLVLDEKTLLVLEPNFSDPATAKVTQELGYAHFTTAISPEDTRRLVFTSAVNRKEKKLITNVDIFFETEELARSMNITVKERQSTFVKEGLARFDGYLAACETKLE